VETAPLDVAAPEIPSSEAPSPEGAPADAIAPEPVAAAETGDVADVPVADIANDAPPAAEERAASSATLLPNVAFSSDSSDNEAAAAEADLIEVNLIEADLIEVLPDPAASTEAPAAEAPAPEAPQVQAASETTTDSVAVDGAAAANAGTALETAPDAIAVPEMVDVWRPGGRSEERRPRHDRSRHRHQGHQDRPQEGVQPAAAAVEATDGAKRERHGRGRRDRGNDFRKPLGDAPVEAAAAPAEGAPVREPRDDKGRPPRERFAGKGRESDKYKGKPGGGRDHGSRDKGGRDKREGGPSHRQFATSAPPRERERPVDPNSPFAKLAALKEQLTANRKDPR
jgi:ATP-dependent RNA helicase SUPV3L1/SUV3